MNGDPTPTLMSIGRCFVGALHGPSDKANDKVSVVNWNSGIRMAPSSKYCSAQLGKWSHAAGQQGHEAANDCIGQTAECECCDQSAAYFGSDKEGYRKHCSRTDQCLLIG